MVESCIYEKHHISRYGHEILNTCLLLYLLSDTTSLIPKYFKVQTQTK